MRVYVHGNCQAPAIATLFGEVFPDWSIASYEVHSEKVLDEIEAYRSAVAEADVIVSQPIHDGYRGRDDLSLAWVRANAKPDTPIVIFPSMFFNGQLVGWRSVSIPGYTIPYQDVLVLHCAALGISATRIISIIANEDVYPDAFIEQEIGLSIDELKRREALDGIDVLLSPFLEEYGRTTRLFHVINHPYRQALVYIANGVLGRLGYGQTVPYLGADCIRLPHVPLSASVQRFLRKNHRGDDSWEIADAHKFHLPKGVLTRAEYVLRVVDHLRTFPRESLMACLQAPHVLPFLQRLAIAAPAIPRIEMWRKAA